MDILTFINSLTNKDLNRIRNSKSDAEARRLLREYQALQLQQTGVMQSVLYSIVYYGTVLEKFKEKETAEYALEEYKRMGFPYATILETVA